MRDPAAGTLRLTSCSYPPESSARSSCQLTGMLTVPGMAPAAVEHSGPAPAHKWPQPGQEVPVRVDRADPRRLVILWDEVPANRAAGRRQVQEQARLLAEQMKPGQAAARPGRQSQATGDPSTPPPGVQGSGNPGEAADQAAGTPGAQTTRAGAALGPPQTMMTGIPQPGMPGGLAPDQGAAMLLNSGGLRRATATVLAVDDVTSPATPGAAAGVVDLSLEVSDPPGPSYPAVIRVGFGTPQRRALIASVGSVLPVLVDPVEKGRVVIEVSQFRD